MSEVAIAVEQLSKRYRIGQGARSRYGTLRDRLTGVLAAPRRWLVRQPSAAGTNDAEHTLWALRDISFEVKRGEVVGIIGRNGAGKSTLLKILSRITQPTAGRITVRGRVGSLLEVGTGFHPELTGRENIYLNGAILGMRREEIARKFDEIIDFAEIERFLDTPVKFYSSGMYTRLAFAVAAHLESEILVVDEVLAVGDAAFQKKCLGKIEEIGSQGRTVFFVSHSMPAVLRLCERVILLDHGGVVADGTPHTVVGRYLRTDVGGQAEIVWPSAEQAPGDAVARLRAVRVRDWNGRLTETIDVREPLSVEVEYWNLQSRLRPTVSIHFVNEEGACLFVSNDFSNRTWWSTARAPGIVRAICKVPGNLLAEGRICILAALVSYNPHATHAIERDAVSFQVIDRSNGDGVRGEFVGAWPGLVRPMLDWEITTE